MLNALIIDDEQPSREELKALLADAADIEVIGECSNAIEGLTAIHRLRPDVVFLDIQMPRMDGITFLKKLMAQHPIPVVMCSSLIEEGSETLMQTLEAGAVEVILKPRVDTRQSLMEARMRICDSVKAAAAVSRTRHRGLMRSSPSGMPALRIASPTATALSPARTRSISRTWPSAVAWLASSGEERNSMAAP